MVLLGLAWLEKKNIIHVDIRLCNRIFNYVWATIQEAQISQAQEAPKRARAGTKARAKGTVDTEKGNSTCELVGVSAIKLKRVNATTVLEWSVVRSAAPAFCAYYKYWQLMTARRIFWYYKGTIAAILVILQNKAFRKKGVRNPLCGDRMHGGRWSLQWRDLGSL
jgi:hypothetical protein